MSREAKESGVEGSKGAQRPRSEPQASEGKGSKGAQRPRSEPQASEGKDFDTSDVDRWIGVPLGGAHMKDDVHVNDIRRWVQGMQNPNPLHYDDDHATASRFGRIVAPQSFAVCTDDSHGAAPAIQGHIPGTHMIFGGDEWWFFGPRIEPGDRMRQDRMLFDYKVVDTKFAGPTMFSRGDTTYVNQRGEVVCKQRSTSVRYRADAARERGYFMQQPEEPGWTDAQLAEIEKQRFEYHQSIHDLGHERRLFVKEGDRLPTRVIGPHTLMSFTTEWRSYLMTVWGAFRQSGCPRWTATTRPRASTPRRRMACTRDPRAGTSRSATPA
jgi:hypothetical protein